MTYPEDMSRACDVMQEEIEWFEGQDWSGISESERRGIFARHLAMYLDTAGFDLSNDVPTPEQQLNNTLAWITAPSGAGTP